MGLTDRLAAAQRARTDTHRCTAGEVARHRRPSTPGQEAQDRTRPVRGRQAGRPRPARRLPRPQALRRPHDAERAGEQRPARAPGRDRVERRGHVRSRPHPHHAGDLRRHPRLRAAGATAPRRRPVRGHGQRLRLDLRRAQRQARQDRHVSFSDEAHLRRTIDKIVGKIGRRVDEASPMVDARLPDGSRVNAIIPPLALDGSKLTIRKFSEDPYTVQDLINFGSLTAVVGQPARGVRQGPAQHPGLGRHGRRQDDDAQRAVVVHPGRRAHRHHRGRRRAPAGPGPRPAPRVAPAQHRGQGRGHHPRPGQELAAHAPRPHRRRRDP